MPLDITSSKGPLVFTYFGRFIITVLNVKIPIPHVWSNISEQLGVLGVTLDVVEGVGLLLYPIILQRYYLVNK